MLNSKLTTCNHNALRYNVGDLILRMPFVLYLEGYPVYHDISCYTHTINDNVCMRNENYVHDMYANLRCAYMFQMCGKHTTLFLLQREEL